MSRVVGAVVLLIGMWIFLFPFIGPVMGLYLVPPPTGAAGHMAMPMGTMRVITVDRGMVFSNFIPGMLLAATGIYHIFKERPASEAV